MPPRPVARLLCYSVRLARPLAEKPEQVLVLHGIAPPSPPEVQTGAVAWAKGRLLGYLQGQWDSVRLAAPGSIRNYAYRAVEAMLERIEPDEVSFRRLSGTSGIQVLHSPATPASEVLEDLRLRARGRERFHTHYYRLSWAALGITVPLLVLPIPSLPFWWNVFRIWGNGKALGGVSSLLRVLPEQAPKEQKWPPCRGPQQGECCRVPAAPGGDMLFIPCAEVGRWEPDGPTVADETGGLDGLAGTADHTAHAIRFVLKERGV